MKKADDSANARLEVEHKTRKFVIKRLGIGRTFRIELEGGGVLPRALAGTYIKQEDAINAIEFYKAAQEAKAPKSAKKEDE